MTRLMLSIAGVALALAIGQPGVPVHAQSPTSDSRQHGYEHGYRDGADRGRQDRERGLGRTFHDNDYLAGGRDYDPAFGNRRDFMSGYGAGFKAGYDDGYDYDQRQGQYGQIYRGGGPGASMERQAPSARRPNPAGSADAAFDAGYREGVTAGQQDQRENVRSDFRDSPAYQAGDADRRSGGGDRNANRQDFQDGFERGYQDGYGRSRYSSDGGGYYPNRNTTGAADTRDGVGSFSRTIIVPGTRQWTPTTIRVNQGDLILLDTTGEIRWTANAKDRAISAGSLGQQHTPGAPLPDAFVGALIGRIDGGKPFGVGNLTSIVAPASGLLYLGINDDNVSDNGGQFQVVISW